MNAGIILYEVYSRKDPYEGESFHDVMEKISDPAINKRPGVPEGCPAEMTAIMQHCLMGEPIRRPSFKDLYLRLKSLDAGKLEPTKLRNSLSASFGKKNTNHDRLLEEVFPPHIARALRDGRKVEPESHDMV